MTGRRRGPLLAATWLIGLGVLFLVQRAGGWSMTESWPLFVILAGVAGVVGALVPERRRARGLEWLWALTWPVAWIVAGGALLAATTGQLSEGPAELVDRVWPWAAVGLGAWFLLGAVVPLGQPAVEALALDLGTRSDARVTVRFGAGDLHLGTAAAGHLLDGTYRGGVLASEPAPGRIELEQDLDRGLPWVDHDADWMMGLTDRIPLDLRLDTGACRSDLDLGDLRLRSLELHTGASQTRVRAPRSAGLTRMRAEAGAAELIIEVPPTVAARIHGTVAIGALAIDEARFPKAADGLYVSSDFASAENRLDLEIHGGLGSVKVIGQAPVSLAA